MVHSIFRFFNGQVFVFDEHEKQIPALQGRFEDKAIEIVRQIMADLHSCMRAEPSRQGYFVPMKSFEHAVKMIKMLDDHFNLETVCEKDKP